MDISLIVIAVVVAIWLITSKSTRKSVGASLVEVSLTAEQSLKIARASAFNEAKNELGDLMSMLRESDEFLNQTGTSTPTNVPNIK